MYKVFFIFLFIILPAAAENRTIVTRTPVYNYPAYNNSAINYNYQNPHHYYPQTRFDDISALEKYTLNKSYPRENNIQRLERLEMQAFGAVQQGDLNTRYNNARAAILSRPKQNYKTSLLRNIGNYFSGQMTGFTPDITGYQYYQPQSFSYTPYPTTYGNSSFDQFSGPFGTGYRINNYSTGSSAGVRILD